MSTRVRIGVAGAGVFGGYHCSKVSEHPKAVLSGVFDIDGARASSLAEKNSSVSYLDYSAMLEATDAVIVAAAANAHFALASEALARGRHVFVEKPITLTTHEADALIALSNEQGVILQAGHQERYVAAAAGLLDRKTPPHKIDCIRHTMASGRCEDVSVVLDLMVHDLDLIRMLTQSEINTIEAHGGQHEAKAELQLTNGAVISLSASRRAPTPERRMTLVYDDGIVEFDFVNRKTTNTTETRLVSDFAEAEAPAAFRDPLAFGADAFINAILNSRAPIVTGADAREALAWAQRIEAAAAIGPAASTEAQERRRA
ncbi:MAG: Gfo/Idh/MocA family oxidoreductase [Pseudomonadota bacterium]